MAAQLNDIEARVGPIVEFQAIEVDEDGGTKRQTFSAHLAWNPPTHLLALKREGEAPPDGKKLVIAGTAFLDSKEDPQVVKVFR